jgi:hypothetical protein
MRTRRETVGLALALVALPVLISACSSSPSSNTTSPSPSASSGSSSSAVAEITANWKEFFAGTSSAARKVALLQNGQKFAAIIRAQANSPIAKGTQAAVSAVVVVSPAEATVTYSILIDGQVALSNQTGQAVLQSGVWKVGSTSFCALLALEGQQVPFCPASSPASSPSG